jgi:formylglycine-generating enzyme required for sulfatase activity
MGRYPATNSQYSAFVDDGGYRDRRWWSDAGWASLQGEKAAEPLFWSNRLCNSPNQPVIGVNLWEAEACCAWAGGRLPREQEWEAAARGPHGCEYPWCGEWEDGICNTSDARLGVTSPVGLFPRSRQAQLGIEDLAGNIWEWCATLWDDPDNAALTKDPKARRTLHGGSFTDSHVPGAFRFGLSPGIRSFFYGFRVVRSSPS